jgi:hypothetical protein
VEENERGFPYASVETFFCCFVAFLALFIAQCLTQKTLGIKKISKQCEKL